MSNNQCGSCDQPASNICSSCKIQCYCSQTCQQTHWAEHKLACKDLPTEHALKRVSNIAQEVYLKFRENTWMTPVPTVVTTSNEVRFYGGQTTENIFTKFPADRMGDDETKMAVLTFNVGQEPTAFVCDLLRSLLKDIDVKVQEMTVLLTRPIRYTKMTAVHGEQVAYASDKHDTLLLTSNKTGREWVIDISGGQFGICEPFWKFNDYQDRFAATIVSKRSLGWNKLFTLETVKTKGLQAMILGLYWDASVVLIEEAKRWETEHVRLAQLPTLSEEQFAETKGSLLQAVNLRVKGFVRAVDATQRVLSGLEYDSMYPGQSSIEVAKIKEKFWKKVTPSAL